MTSQNKTMDHKYAREAAYEDYAIDLNKVYYQRIIREVRSLGNVGNSQRRILDIGCFDGTLVSQFKPQWNTYGVEGNIKACQRACERGA